MNIRDLNNRGLNKRLLKIGARRRPTLPQRGPARRMTVTAKFWILGITTADTIRSKVP